MKASGNIILLSIFTFITFALQAGEIEVFAPAQISGDSILSVTATLQSPTSTNTSELTLINNKFTTSFTHNTTGLFKVSLQFNLMSGIVLADSANYLITSGSQNEEVRAEINTACFEPTLIVYWYQSDVINAADLYNTVLDTQTVKRLFIENIDSIADAFYDEGLYWYRSMPVHYYILDSNMIPLVKYASGYFRNPVTTSQTVFAFYEQYQLTRDSIDRQGFINNANWLAQNNHAGYYYYEFDFRHTSSAVLHADWVSAMAQGEAIGALSLAFYFLSDSTYLQEADSVFTTFYTNAADFWSFYTDERGYYWLEEYPNDDLCHVLNGKMAALWGLFQYYTITRNKLALRVLEAGLKTVADHYKIWNVANADRSYYCLHHEVKDHYHAVHKNQYLTFAERFNIEQFYDAYFCLGNKEIQVFPESICVDYIADTFEIFVDSYASWTVESSADWLQVCKNETSFHIYIDSNLTNQQKHYQLPVAFSTGDTIYVSVEQEPESYYFLIQTDTIKLDPAFHQISVPVSSNLSEIDIINNYDWVGIAFLDDSLDLTIGSNTSFIERNGKIYFYKGEETFDSLFINQAGTAPILSISDDTLFFNANTEGRWVSVLTNQDDLWVNIAEDWVDFDWLNDTILGVFVLENSSQSERMAIAELSTALSAINLVVVQKGKSLHVGFPGDAIVVYPNPASDIIWVEDQQRIIARYEIYTLSGRLMASEELIAAFTPIDIEALIEGIYILSLIDSDGKTLKSLEIVKTF